MTRTVAAQKKARQSGDSWEAAVEATNLRYEQQRRFWGPPRARVEKRLVGGRVIYATKAPVDFCGFIPGDPPRPVAFDAKSFKTRLDLDPWQDTPSDPDTKSNAHQRRKLESCVEMGGIAFLLVRCTKLLPPAETGRPYGPRSWVVGLHRLQEQFRLGKWEFTPADLDRLGIAIEGSDWLPALSPSEG